MWCLRKLRERERKRQRTAGTREIPRKGEERDEDDVKFGEGVRR